MKLLDLTLPSPAENLALDEALLDAAEAGSSGETLRFWASPVHFVVVGYANRVRSEVNLAACERNNIPILRRCSGGGTVVQGPGCLNYALVLRIDDDGPTRNISAANQFIMERNRTALASALCTPHSALSIQGHTDLVLTTQHGTRATLLKFSGNSQRRRKNFLLFHGCLLLNFNLPLIGELLHMPSLQPDYRVARPHDQFITNLSLPMTAVKQALTSAWLATETTGEQFAIPPVLLQKYRSVEWNQKF